MKRLGDKFKRVRKGVKNVFLSLALLGSFGLAGCCGTPQQFAEAPERVFNTVFGDGKTQREREAEKKEQTNWVYMLPTIVKVNGEDATCHKINPNEGKCYNDKTKKLVGTSYHYREGNIEYTNVLPVNH